MRRQSRLSMARILPLGATTLFALLPALALGQDPPHNGVNQINCSSCHMPHQAPGAALTAVAGNPNLCQSCHRAGGPAATKPFVDADQALPGGVGTSHRWDSGPSGFVRATTGNVGDGRVRSDGAYVGRVERTYLLTVTSSGDAGAAVFAWSDDAGASGSGLIGGSNVPLDLGLVVTFVDGDPLDATPSFFAGDRFMLRVRTDIVWPASELIATPMSFAENKAVCSACHNQHLQLNQPFDPSAPDYAGSGSGAGRHYQRIANDTAQMCRDCHAPRDVTSSSLGSHPIRVPLPVGATWRTPALPLDSDGHIECLSCHSPHFTSSGGANGGLGDGYILRTSLGVLCVECHALADTAAGSHFDTTSGALWPGGQYGSGFPTHSADKRGMCVNCHWPHGWPDDATPASDFPRLWVERYDTGADRTDPDDAEDLCFTCHDGSPAQANVRAEILKGTNGAEIFHHPVADSQQTAGRSVECVDCHNPHRATSSDRHAGVGGVDLAGAEVGYGTSQPRPIQQFELCFKCHGDSFNSSRPRTSNKRLDFSTATTNSAYHPVTQAGRGSSSNLTDQLLAGLTTSSTIRCTDCHNSDETGAALGVVVDSTALTVGPHGSTQPVLLRARFGLSYTGAAWNDLDGSLCFRCHDQARLLARRRGDDPPSRTNFYNADRDSLHWLHLTDKSTTSSCLSCHFDLHSNRSASNTEYRVLDEAGVASAWTSSPPSGVKSHLVNFAPDVAGTNGNSPRWQIDLRTGTRSCWVTCHGREMNPETYAPPAGDETNHRY